MEAVSMTRMFFLASAALGFTVFAGFSAQAADKSVLDVVKERGALRCSAHNGSSPGYFEVDPQGHWKGFDIDFCRAVATAILGSPDKVEFVPLSWAQRFPSLQSGDIDVLIKQTNISFSRDTKLGIQFSVPYFFGATQLMAPAKLNVKTPKDLEGATVCTASGTSAEPILASFQATNGVKFQLVTYEKTEELNNAYLSGRCDAMLGYAPIMAVTRALRMPNLAENVILPFNLTMEAEAAAVKQNDKQFLNVVDWTILALIKAEELGISSNNVDSLRQSLIASPDSNLEAARLLGVKPGLGEPLGLQDDWAYKVVKSVGNFGDIYDRNIGTGSPYKLPRGLNNLWNKGGLLFAPTFD
jgi:general L-amino acid transport system substrate-binding protein